MSPEAPSRVHFRSLTQRLILTVLLIEIGLAAFVTMAALYYQREESLEAFDVMLHGRADSVLGSVQDAEDAANNVLLDKSSLDAPPRDLYEVREEDGHFLGHSGANAEALPGVLEVNGKARDFKVVSKHYRGIAVRGSRMIDPEQGPGIVHHMLIFYASPIKPVWEAVWRAARFFLLADLLALLLSVAAVALLIRRSLWPLDSLAHAAAGISPRSLNFKAPRAAYQLRELRPLASGLDQAMQRVERAFVQQRNFVNDAAHELKTAVTVLKSSLQLLTFRDRSKGEYQAGIELCLADTDRMEDLVQRMLTLARLEQQEKPPAASVRGAQVAEVIRGVLSQVDAAASVRGLRMVAEIEDERRVPLTMEDCSTLVTNLVINAIQHSPEGAEITVSLRPDGQEQMMLAVADHGEGIPPEHLPFIYERFYRADASRSRETGGTGLGLAICKAIVESPGGTIRIESEVGKGTCVSIYLPVMNDAVNKHPFPAAKTESSVR